MYADRRNNPPPVEFSGLHCPTCDYDLTGLSKNRCPECGERFDRRILRKIAAGEPLPAVPYETDHTLRGLWKTWWLALTNRGKLADKFPPVHHRGNALLYTLFCFHIALFLNLAAYLRLAIILDDYILRGPFLLLTFPLFLWIWLFQTLVAAGLALLVPPRRVRAKFRFWRGLTHYTSGYSWLLSPLIVLTSLVCPSLVIGSCEAVIAGCQLAVVFWWISAFWIMAARRGKGVFRIALAWLWVVLAGFIAAMVTNIFSAIIQLI